MTPALLALGPFLLALGQGLEVPENDGWVTDRAGILEPAEERALEDLMESYRTGSGQEIAVLTVPDLGGRTIEEYALEVARAWKIGDRETSSGALLVVARDERELRIEVGRGLEGTLTDSIAGRIIRDVIVPEFREGRFGAGIRQGIEAIHAALGGDYGPIEGRGHGSPATLLFPLAIIVLLTLLSRRGYRGRRGRGASMLPWILASQMGSSGWRGGRHAGSTGGGFRGFGGGGGFSGGGASGRW